MTDHALASLTKRRAELLAEAKAADTLLRRLQTDLEHIDGAIRLYDPAYRPRKVVLRRNKATEVSRVVLGVLREATAPMTLRDITLAMMAALGLDQADAKLVADRKEKVRTMLMRQRRAGVVRSEERVGKGLLWEVAR